MCLLAGRFVSSSPWAQRVRGGERRDVTLTSTASCQLRDGPASSSIFRIPHSSSLSVLAYATRPSSVLTLGFGGRAHFAHTLSPSPPSSSITTTSSPSTFPITRRVYFFSCSLPRAFLYRHSSFVRLVLFESPRRKPLLARPHLQQKKAGSFRARFHLHNNHHHDIWQLVRHLASISLAICSATAFYCGPTLFIADSSHRLHHRDSREKREHQARSETRLCSPAPLQDGTYKRHRGLISSHESRIVLP